MRFAQEFRDVNLEQKVVILQSRFVMTAEKMIREEERTSVSLDFMTPAGSSTPCHLEVERYLSSEPAHARNDNRCRA